MTAVD